MACNVFYSSDFNKIVDGNLPSPLAPSWQNTQKTIISVSREIIDHLQKSNLQGNEKALLDKFVTKINKLELVLNPDIKARLKLHSFAIQTLGTLRSGSNPTFQDLANDPFIMTLIRNKNTDTLKDPLSFLVELTEFQEKILVPALKKATTKQDLIVLEPLIDECISSAKKLKADPLTTCTSAHLIQAEKTLIDLWNARHLQVEPSYQRLLRYQKGSLGDLSNEDYRKKTAHQAFVLFSQFSKDIKNPNYTHEDKTSLYRAMQLIEAEFAEAGEPIQFPKRPLMRELGISIPKSASVADVKEISANDLAVARKLSVQIIERKPTIGDANAYKFSARYGSYIDDAKTKQGSLDMLAAGMRANAKGKSYSNSPEEIVKLGQDLLRNNSGQCDHMAAAVIAKLVLHIRQGGRWDADVELAGNGGHSFVIINRPQGETTQAANWKGAVIVDTWLGAIGVHPSHQKEIPYHNDGIISDPQEVKRFATAFGARTGSIKILRRFSAEELRTLAFSQANPLSLRAQ